MQKTFDILIAGAGIVGLSAGLLLAQGAHRRRFRVRIVDAGPPPAFDPDSPVDIRVSAVSAGSAALFDAAGAWRHLAAERCCPFDHMRVWDAAGEPDGATTLRFDADEFAVPHLGWIVENRLLQHALLTALASLDADLTFDTAIDAIDFADDRPGVTFADGSAAAVDLVIAADGADSAVRREAGLPVREYAYGQEAFVTHLACEHSHAYTAWQRFLPDGPLGLLPLADGRVSVVRTTSPEGAAELLQLDDDALGDALTEATDAVLGRLTAAGPRGTFPLVARHARDYVRAGAALIGDAAHTVHPLAGQGANLGIADAAALARVLDQAVGRGEHPGDRPVLRRYERARKGENALMLQFMTGLNRLFASDSALLGELRRAGLALFNRSGPIRATITGIALGSASGQ